MRILVTGSRDWNDFGQIRRSLEAVVDYMGGVTEEAKITVVHGAARGADSMAKSIALEKGWRIESHPAHWTLYGRRAGFIRNVEMVKLGADVCVAFIKDQSRGATMCADLAEKAGIFTERICK